ncbi:MAG TPA: lipopolysaccharide biosynthesis protein [Cyclobacteriaceae bacterium]
MGIVIRQSFWSVVFAYTGVLVGFLNVVVLMPKYLTPDEIGLWRTFVSISSFSSPLVLLGSQKSITKFLPKFNEKEKTSLILSLLMLTLFAFLALSVSFFVFQEQLTKFFVESIPDIKTYLIYILALIFSMSLFSFIESISSAYLDISTPNFIREIIYKTSHLLIIVLVGYGFLDFYEYLISQLVIYVFMTLSLTFSIVYKNKINFSKPVLLPGILLRKVLNFGLFSILDGFSGNLYLHIDKLIIAKYLGLKEVAVYTTAIFIARVILIPQKYIGQISVPIITKFFQNGAFNKIEDHNKAAAINQMIISSFIFFMIYYNVQEIYALMPNGDIYREGAVIVIIIGAIQLMNGSFGINSPILVLSEHYRKNTYILFFIGVLNLVLNILLIPKYGMIGAAVASLFSYFVRHISQYILIQKYFHINTFTIKNLYFLLFVVILFFTKGLFSHFTFDIYINVAIKSISLCLAYILYALIMKPSREIYEIASFLSKKLRINN